MVLGHAGEAYFQVQDSEEDSSAYKLDKNKLEAPAPGYKTSVTKVEGPLPPRPVVRTNIQMSLCGHLLIGLKEESQHDRDVFMANLLDWSAFESDPSLWYHPSLVFKFGPNSPYLPARVSLPLIASWAIFNRPLDKASFTSLLQSRLRFKDANDTIENLQINVQEILHRQPLPLPLNQTSEESVPGVASNLRSPRRGKCSKNRSFLRPGSAGILASCCSPVTTDLNEGLLREGEEETEDAQHCQGETVISIKQAEYTRRLKPTCEQLEKLGLKPGANRITFSVCTALQGYKSVSGTIYLWPRNSKIVISDVDGTITKSDLWGQLMPIVGKDWSHEGVADLFTNIRKRDYRMVYLTARAIGQADATRDYLFGLTQGNNCQLPDGPLILSPDRLFPSFKREVIDRKPFVFKIAALRDLRMLFPPYYNPFYAGFGNRDTDHRAYVHVGVPEARIFIVDPTGQVHHVNKTFAKTYTSMTSMINEMFPPLQGRNKDVTSETTNQDDLEDPDELRDSKRLGVNKEPLKRFLSPITPHNVDPYAFPLERNRNPVTPSPGVADVSANRGSLHTSRVKYALRS